MNNNGVTKVEIVETPDRIGGAGTAMTFIFTMLTMCFWGIYAGIFSGPTALAVGLVQIACYMPYMIGAVVFYMKGNALFANTFLIFATLFGGIGGLSNIFLGFAEIYGWNISDQMTCIPFIWGGVCLFPVTYVLRKAISKMTFICYLSAAFFLSLIGFVGLGVLPPATNTLITILALIVALTGYYECLNGLLMDGGHKPMPNGKPFFK